MEDGRNEPRIRVRDADVDPARETPTRPPLGRILFVVATIALTFALITSRPPEPPAAAPLAADAIAQPETDPGFVPVATLPSGPWDPYRVSGAYLFESPDGPVVVTDGDLVSQVDLPGLDVLFGAIPTSEGSLAFGRSHLGPTLWWSTDNLTWTLEALPWDGTVRAAASRDGRLTVIGIETDELSFSYIVASREPGSDWEIRRDAQVPDSHLVSIPGGFIGRGHATDGTGSGVGYLFSDDGIDWTFQSERAAGISRTGGVIPSFVDDSGPEIVLRIADDRRPVDPPAWPISGLWVEGAIIWIQTPDAAWSSVDGTTWTEYPVEVDSGFSVLLPVGEVPRIATVDDDTVLLLRWDPGTPSDAGS